MLNKTNPVAPTYCLIMNTGNASLLIILRQRQASSQFLSLPMAITEVDENRLVPNDTFILTLR
jgi:hypothetical protein